MCTVGFDGRLPLTFLGWQGENASLSLLRNSELDSIPDNGSVLAESYFLNAKLILTDVFEELEIHSRVPITSVKLFLTDTKIIVARLTEDFSSSKKTLTHLRTHDIKEVDVEVDGIDSSVMCLTTRIGRKFLYKLEKGAAGVSSWMNRLFRLKRNSVSPSSSSASTTEERQQQQQSSTILVSSPFVCTNSSSIDGLLTESTGELTNNDSSSNLECNSNPEHSKKASSKKFSPLKRRKAFRNTDVDRSFRTRTRSSSTPPDGKMEEPTVSLPSSLVVNGDVNLSPTTSNGFFELPSRHSLLQKGKLKASPRANKFTRALSARLMHTPTSNDDEQLVEVRRVKSLTNSSSNSSSTLPRSWKRSGKRSKSKSAFFESNSFPSTPGTPKPKSPGSILKLFHRRSTLSSLNLEEYLSSMEESDLSNVDIQNKPKQLKLFLQPQRQLAEELTLIDSESFRNIEQAELLNGAWTKKTKHSTSPNILKMIDSFNRLARIVCTEIVHEKTANNRAKAITNYIQIAGKLYKIHNYNSLKAVVSGLQSQAVYRLEKSWNQVPSRKRKKFDKYSKFLSEMDVADRFKEMMQYYVTNNIQCVPYLGWLLTYTLHYQTFKKLQQEREMVPLHQRTSSASCSSLRKSVRESVCSLSLPASPIQSDNEEGAKIESIAKNFSSEVLHLKKSYSDTNMQTYINESNSSSPGTVDTSMSPQEEVDFGYPLDRKFSNSLHPLAVNVMIDEISLTPRLKRIHQSSFDSSVEESIQTDSAIGLDSSSQGQPSPAHKRDNRVVKPDKHKAIQFSGYVQKHFHTESMPSLSSYANNDYVLPIIDCDFEEDSDIEETSNGMFGSSFMGTSCSISSSHSPSPNSPPPPRSPSLLSPSLISFTVTSEPSTLRKAQHHNRLLSFRQYQNEAISICSLDYYSSIVFIPICGILFSSCPGSMERFDFPYCQPGVTFEEIVKQIKDLFDVSVTKNSLVKFSTPLNSTLNIANMTDHETSCETGHDSVISPSLSHSPSDRADISSQLKKHYTPITADQDNVLVQYQMNTLNYSCEFTSRHYMRSLINYVPWLDENQCHEVSVEVEPS